MHPSATTEITLERRGRMYYLFLIFLTGCLVGWIYEEIFYWITEGMLRNRGILYGPWLPIYGTGALVFLLLLNKVRDRPALLFVLAMVAAGVIEYFTHLGLAPALEAAN